MTNDNQIKPHPFTGEQLNHFINELKESGGVDELMLEKEAIKKDGETPTILNYENIEEYKNKYLTGIYESLRKDFNTTVPYVFWSRLYEVLLKAGRIK